MKIYAIVVFVSFIGTAVMVTPPYYRQPYGDTPAVYNFNYGVKDDYAGLDFGHQEARDGDVTTGEYRVLLPDGRVQIVSYTVNGDEGYVAKVRYEAHGNYGSASAPAKYQVVAPKTISRKYEITPKPSYHKRPASYYRRKVYKGRARTYTLSTTATPAEGVPVDGEAYESTKLSAEEILTTSLSPSEPDAPTTTSVPEDLPASETPAPYISLSEDTFETETPTPSTEPSSDEYQYDHSSKERNSPSIELKAPEAARRRRQHWRYGNRYRYY